MHESLATCRAFATLLLGAGIACVQTAAADATAMDVVTLEKRQWATATNGPDLTWPEADTYCADLTLGGHDDWRLPTLMELETLHDPAADSGIREPISLDGCCLWSSTSLEDRAAEDGDEIAGEPGMYRWGYMFDGGLYYYAVHIFEDGQALCMRDD
ncbi:MAG: DUF1566 domain-containing protein [Chromatocurvus sp.]